jgi:predicted ATP-grasp superfamily ATP-dependent carboligase
MRIKDSSTPVLILGCKIGALAIMRSLGSQGVPVYGIDDNPQSPALYSRFLEEKFIQRYDEDRPDTYLDYVLAIGKRLGQRAILIPTSDELTIFVEESSRQLKSHFLFPENSPGLLKRLASKDQMFRLASENGVSTASTSFPRNIDDVLSFSKSISYPVMLKGIHGNRLQARTGEKMVIVNSKEELIENYQQLEDPDSPNLMIQEYIPGGDDQVYIFNGYFNEQSDCLAAFTGFKER